MVKSYIMLMVEVGKYYGDVIYNAYGRGREILW